MASEISQQGDLDWMAFQFAAGELRGPELEAFELLLASDLAACEALAKAVLLSQAIAVCESQLPNSSGLETPRHAIPELLRRESNQRQDLDIKLANAKSASRPIPWHSLALVGSAACLALMANWIGTGTLNPRSPQPLEMTAGVVSLWIDGVESNGSFATSEQISRLPNEAIEDVTDEMRANVAIADVTDLDSGDDDAIPGWMLAAVAQRQHELADHEEEVIQD